MKYTHPDQDSEEIEPLVPEIAGGTEQVPELGPSKMNSSCLPLYQSVSDEIHYFTWDIEQIEPLVPIMNSGGINLE